MRLGRRHLRSGALGRFLGFALMTMLLLWGNSPAAADVVLDGMPSYGWWGGCVPTSAGMVMGYWNSSRYPLFDGDTSVWNSSDAAYSSNQANGLPGGTAAMVASWEHVHEGQLLSYNTSIGMGHYTPLSREADCLADFLYTDQGNTAAEAIADGLVDFAAWDNPDTELNESVQATSQLYWTFANPDPWGVYVSEIDAGRPSIVLLRESTSGHAIAGYGYRIVGETRYMAVEDTWNDGLTWAPSGSSIEDGVEWWPWTATWASPGSATYGLDLGGYAYDEVLYGARGWTVDAVVTFDAEAVPEPGTLALLLVGLGAVAARRARRRRDALDEE